MDVMKGEVVRVLQLADSSIVPVMMIMIMMMVTMKMIVVVVVLMRRTLSISSVVINDNVCTQVPWIVPRKTYRDFHADIFPDTAGAEPVMVRINDCLHHNLAKGRLPTKKNYFFRALAELALPPPHALNSGNLVLFFRTSKTTYCAYYGKSTNNDNEG